MNKCYIVTVTVKVHIDYVNSEKEAKKAALDTLIDDPELFLVDGNQQMKVECFEV